MDINEEALTLHKNNVGKLMTVPKVKVNDRHDLSVVYTPGVAAPCLKIKENKDLSFEYTCRGNMVAVVTDGTRVLGLGNIGPEASLPVMEGKAVLYKVFGGLDSVPIALDVSDKDKFIETVRYLQPNFAGINLEDIASPKCYDIEDELKKIMDIPVFHDDQHGTAIACAATVLGALRLVKKELGKVKVVLNGAGAAGTAIARLLLDLGVNDLIMLNSKGAMYEGMDMARVDRVQRELLQRTNKKQLKGSLAEVAVDADILIGVSSANVFTPAIIQKMAQDAIVLALANPVPEISYVEAKKAGARVVGTGRSDAPNQVNNVSVFPGLFRGAIDVRARKINEEMKKAATLAIANLIPEDELREDYVVPSVFDVRVAPEVAAKVAEAAIKSGVARVELDTEIIKKNTQKHLEQMKNFLAKF